MWLLQMVSMISRIASGRRTIIFISFKEDLGSSRGVSYRQRVLFECVVIAVTDEDQSYLRGCQCHCLHIPQIYVYQRYWALCKIQRIVQNRLLAYWDNSLGSALLPQKVKPLEHELEVGDPITLDVLPLPLLTFVLFCMPIVEDLMRFTTKSPPP